jgi:pullulanase/glycogen debranching enzyme
VYEAGAAEGGTSAGETGAGATRDGPGAGEDGPDTTEASAGATGDSSGATEDEADARALWLDRACVAWPRDLGGDHFELAGHPEVTLRPAGPVDAARAAADPRARGHVALAVGLDPQSPAWRDILTRPLAVGLDPQSAVWRAILTGPLAVRAFAGGLVVVETGVQVGGLLDDLYGAAADQELGVAWDQGVPTARLWAPTARAVRLLLWDDPAGDPRAWPADLDSCGVWSVVGEAGWKDHEWLWEVEVCVAGATVANRVTDPYATALTVDSRRGVLVDLADPAWAPELWAATPNPPALRTQAAQTIYELHVRDFSAADTTVPAEWRGTYKAFTVPDSAGVRHLKDLAAAGVTTVHLLPTFDVASIPESRAAQAAPAVPDAAPDSPAQQAAVAATADEDAYNWGYDPWHWGAPEGSYATDGHQSGGARVAEFREMVGALHGLGLRVVLDQVFNHTAAAGQSPDSVLDRIVPGYYHRLSAAGVIEHSAACNNVAVERTMAGKLVVDLVVRWARDHRVDGFRFDLMGHHPLANLRAVRAALDPSVYVYGEGWTFGEVRDDRLFTAARQANLAGTGIGSFNDRLRDAVRGGRPFDVDQRAARGYATGLGERPTRRQHGRLAHAATLIKLGLVGNLADYPLPDPARPGKTILGRDLAYEGQAAGHTAEPWECVNYVDAHDNETLYDNGVWKLPAATPLDVRVRLNTLALATTALGQAPCFWHAGTEILRSKSLDRDSYDSGDHANAIDWSLQTNVFGTGLPSARDNASRWPAMRPLLANPALKPDRQAMASARAQALDLLRLRSSTPLFTLGSAALIHARVTFPATDPVLAPGLIAMLIDDRPDLPDGDLDPTLEAVLTVFNPYPHPVAAPIAGLRGRAFTLHPVQRSGADPTVRATTWDPTTGTITVPPRTVAVLVA